MCLLTDPSCYEALSKKKDYLCHIFASNLEVYPIIHVGDIVRIHRAKLEARENKRPDIRVFHEHDVVVFPLDDSQSPCSAAAHFQLTEEDMAEVKKLKIWSAERYGQTVGIKPPESAEPQLITLNVPFPNVPHVSKNLKRAPKRCTFSNSPLEFWIAGDNV